MKALFLTATTMFLLSTPVFAECPTFHELKDGQLARASEVMDNFNVLLNCPNFSGNVGIGTAQPSARLEVNGSVIAGSGTQSLMPSLGALFLTGVNRYGDFPSLVLYNAGGGAGSSVSVDFFNTTAHADIPQAKIKASDDGAYSDHLLFLTKMPGASTNPLLERMRITSSGYVGIGTNNPASTLDVNGTISCSNCSSLSDLRLKKNISHLSLDGLHSILQLRPVSFYWRTPKDEGMQGAQMGFIAQDVEKVLPSSVTTSKDAAKTKAMKYNEITTVLVKALQEEHGIVQRQAARLAEQEQALAKLRDQNSKLSERLDRLERSSIAKPR